MKSLYAVLGFGALLMLMAFTNVAEKKSQLLSAVDEQISLFGNKRSYYAANYSADDVEEYDRSLADMKSERKAFEKDLDEWLSAREKTGDADSLTTVLLGHLVKLCKLPEY